MSPCVNVIMRRQDTYDVEHVAGNEYVTDEAGRDPQLFSRAGSEPSLRRPGELTSKPWRSLSSSTGVALSWNCESQVVWVSGQYAIGEGTGRTKTETTMDVMHWRRDSLNGGTRVGKTADDSESMRLTTTMRIAIPHNIQLDDRTKTLLCGILSIPLAFNKRASERTMRRTFAQWPQLEGSFMHQHIVARHTQSRSREDALIPAMIGTVIADHGNVSSAAGLFQFVTVYHHAWCVVVAVWTSSSTNIDATADAHLNQQGPPLAASLHTENTNPTLISGEVLQVEACNEIKNQQPS